ncbi:hypothetical protein ACS8Y6_15510 [Salinisphaera sp. RV14]|uniref:hypothetical protein n=1 Tax=unclassified Salinisphaera TaxID=2649847 RepID=UPI003F862FC6
MNNSTTPVTLLASLARFAVIHSHHPCCVAKPEATPAPHRIRYGPSALDKLSTTARRVSGLLSPHHDGALQQPACEFVSSSSQSPTGTACEAMNTRRHKLNLSANAHTIESLGSAAMERRGYVMRQRMESRLDILAIGLVPRRYS